MTAATEASGKYAALAKDRWDTLTIGIDQYDASEGNSELISAWMERTREILGRMIHGAHDEHEYVLLGEGENRLLSLLGDEATRLVESVEAGRAKSTKAVNVVNIKDGAMALVSRT